jgi:hypothetical protein
MEKILLANVENELHAVLDPALDTSFMTCERMMLD